MASTCPMLANKYIWTTSNVFVLVPLFFAIIFSSVCQYGISRYIHNIYVVVIANGFVFYLVLHFVWYYIYFTLLFKRTFWLHTLFYFSCSDLERLGGNFAFLSLIGNHLLEEVFEEDFLHLFFHEDTFFYFYQPTIDSNLICKKANSRYAKIHWMNIYWFDFQEQLASENNFWSKSWF